MAEGRARLEPFAFKCTASVQGSNQLADLRAASRSHFIACTVDLLTTGVDVPVVRNIVFFKYVKSPIAFTQMVGRATRIDLPTAKLMFRVYDYTDACRLFGADFKTRHTASGGGDGPGPGPELPEPIIQARGFEVRVSDAGRYIVTMVDGRAQPVTVEECKERLASRLLAEAPTIEQFRRRWVRPPERQAMLEALPEGQGSVDILQAVEELEAYDDFDILADLGYGQAPRTRTDRAEAFGYKHSAWLGALPERGARAIRALVRRFAEEGTDGLENRQVFQTPEVERAGGVKALEQVGEPAVVLQETKKGCLRRERSSNWWARAKSSRTRAG